MDSAMNQNIKREWIETKIIIKETARGVLEI
jgi:hypothetical protein